MFDKTVAESMLGFEDVKEATSGTVCTVEEVRRVVSLSCLKTIGYVKEHQIINERMRQISCKLRAVMLWNIKWTSLIFA